MRRGTGYRGSGAARWLAVLLLALAAPASALSPRAQTGDSAPDALQDPGRTSHTADDGVAPPLVKLWTRDFDNQLTYPLIVGDRVFVAVVSTGASDRFSFGDRIYALDLRTGRVLWRTAIPGPYYTAMLAYDGGRLFVVNWNGLVKAFSPASGREFWETKVPGDHYSDPPVALGGTVYLVSPTANRLEAINERTGYLRWQARAQTCGGSIALDTSRLYLDGCGHLSAYSQATGGLLWQRGRGGSGTITGVTRFGRQLASNDGSTNNAGRPLSELVNPSDGGLVGTFPYSFHAPAVASDLLVVTPLDATQLAGIQTTGRPGTARWTRSTSGQFGQPLVIGRDVFVMDGSRLEVFDGATGAPRGAAIIPSGQVAVQNQLPPADMASAEGYLVVPNESALSVYVSQYDPPSSGVAMGATPQIIVYRARRAITLQGRLGSQIRSGGSTGITLWEQSFGQAARSQVSRGLSYADGAFQFSVPPPTRNTVYTAAPGGSPTETAPAEIASGGSPTGTAPAEVFVYPRTRYRYHYQRPTGEIRATVSLVFDPAVVLAGHLGFLYLDRVAAGTLYRLGRGRLRGSHGRATLSVTFPRPADVRSSDRILFCIHRMTALGLGYPDAVDAGCGAATISYGAAALP